MHKKKLIGVALPLEAISKESSLATSIRSSVDQYLESLSSKLSQFCVCETPSLNRIADLESNDTVVNSGKASPMFR